MLSLLLAIIISASSAQRSLATPGLQRSLGFGIGGIESHQISSSPGYGYGARYYRYDSPMYNPEYSYLTNHQRSSGIPQDVFVPGRVNSFSYPYRSSRSLNPQYFNRAYIPSTGYVQYQPSQFYGTNGALNVPTYSQYHQMPYLQNVAPYSINNTSKPLDTNPSRNSSLEPDMMSGRNALTNTFSLLKHILSSREVDSTAKRERDLQMTYLGYMPSSALSSASQDTFKRSSDGSNHLRVPFYPLSSDSEAFNSQRSESSSPILLSPYRLNDDRFRQSFSNYQQNGFSFGRPVIPQITTTSQSFGSSIVRPGVSPYTNNLHISSVSQQSTTRPTLQFPSFGSVSYPVVPHFRSNTPGRMTKRQNSPLPSTNDPLRYSRTPFEHNQNGYYLFDVQPPHLVHGNEYSRSAYGLEKPKSKVAISDQENRYYIKQMPKSVKYSQRRYEAIPSHGPTYPNFYHDRGYTPEQSDEGETNSFDPGRQLIINPYGPAEMRQLVGRLLTLRRTPMFYSRYAT